MLATVESAEFLTRFKKLDAEALLLPLLLQLGLILLMARLFGHLARRIGQPAVVGEIASGLILGPSVLGTLWPGAFQAIFRPTLHGFSGPESEPILGSVIVAIAQLGLVLLLFLMGLEFEFDHLKIHGTTAVAISLAGIVLPFALGAGLGILMYPVVAVGLPWLGFVLFMGVSMSITAIPTLGRMMIEWNIVRMPIAVVTMGAAAIDDAAGWILLATVAALTRADHDPWLTISTILATTVFTVALFAARPILAWVVRKFLTSEGTNLTVTGLAVVLTLLFGVAAVSSRIGIFAIYGAFLIGAVLSSERDFRDAVNRKCNDLILALFVPVFFAYSGLRTNIGTLVTLEAWLLTLAVTLVAVVGKFAGCALAAWMTGMKPREAACVGAMMNTRGLMELIVVNVGKDLGVIPDSVYTMLVLMALITTFATTPLLVWSMRGTELEPHIRAARA